MNDLWVLFWCFVGGFLLYKFCRIAGASIPKVNQDVVDNFKTIVGQGFHYHYYLDGTGYALNVGEGKIYEVVMHKLLIALLLAGLCLYGKANAQNFDSMENAGLTGEASKTVAGGNQDGACVDDPRLESELLNIMRSNAPINPPITVTPETFLSMDPEILQVLGGQMIICPNVPVLKSGKPMKKVPADFEGLFDNLRKAAIAGDEAKMKQVLTGFTAKPKNAREIVNMLSPVELDDNTRKIMYRAAGIDLPRDPADCLIIDFYKALGGKTNDKTFVVAHPDGSKLDRETCEKNYGQYIDLPSSSYPSVRTFVINKLRMTGVNAVSE